MQSFPQKKKKKKKSKKLEDRIFLVKKKQKKKQAASKKEAGGDAKHVIFFTSPYMTEVNSFCNFLLGHRKFRISVVYNRKLRHCCWKLWPTCTHKDCSHFECHCQFIQAYKCTKCFVIGGGGGIFVLFTHADFKIGKLCQNASYVKTSRGKREPIRD